MKWRQYGVDVAWTAFIIPFVGIFMYSKLSHNLLTPPPHTHTHAHIWLLPPLYPHSSAQVQSQPTPDPRRVRRVDPRAAGGRRHGRERRGQAEGRAVRGGQPGVDEGGGRRRELEEGALPAKAGGEEEL